MSEAGATGDDKKRPPIYDIIGDILADDAFGTGARASLRRNDAGRIVGQPAFFQLMGRINRDVREADALVWGTVVHAIAQTAHYGHDLPAGTALAAGGLSEARFARLMAAEGDALRDQIALVARQLAAKQTSIAWRDLADLVFADHRGDRELADRLRFRIAQAFYSEVRRSDQKARQGQSESS